MCLYNPRTRRLSVAMRNDPYPSQYWTCIVSLAVGLCDVFPPIWLRRCIVCYCSLFLICGPGSGRLASGPCFLSLCFLCSSCSVVSASYSFVTVVDFSRDLARYTRTVRTHYQSLLVSLCISIFSLSHRIVVLVSFPRLRWSLSIISRT